MSIKRLPVKLCLCIVLLCGLYMTGCSGKEESKSEDTTAEIVLITDYGTVNDGSYNQGAWEGITSYCDEYNKTCQYYMPENTDKDSFLSTAKKAIGNGAQVIVCTGYLYEEAMFEAQKKFSNTSFILIDGTPHNEDYSDTTIRENVRAISFSEEQAGFLAGYAAVREGYTGLGFMGGKASPPVIRYGYGFVQGADYAAIETGSSIHVRYVYTDTYSEDPVVEEMAGAWYADDTEVIFACGGQMGRSVMRAAEAAGGKVIGVDTDQSDESETVITSAEKSLKIAVYDSIKAYYEGNFQGGTVTEMAANSGGVCLPMDTSRFEKFDMDSYSRLYEHLIDGMIDPYDGTDIGTTQELDLINTEVSYIMMNDVKTEE